VLVAAGLLACALLRADDSAGEIAGFLDELMSRHLSEYHVPGAAVAVVKDGEIAASRDYGLADLEARTPVDPATTLFRIASITKLLTWTAVMQLEEKGLVDLDGDVNGYLRSVRVPEAFGAPVTLRHLMTHTAGFEDVGIGTVQYLPQPPEASAAYLAYHLPSRVRPPGTTVMYSNHGGHGRLHARAPRGRGARAPTRDSRAHAPAGLHVSPVAAGRPPTGLYVPARRPYTTIEKLNRSIPRARATAGTGGSRPVRGQLRVAAPSDRESAYFSQLRFLFLNSSTSTGLSAHRWSKPRATPSR
jgi:hypothetical protein